MRESDIRARLGKLPKGLTGVYDEILISIKSQPDCNSELAINALKWMLVSERPLKPAELVAAAVLDPSISIEDPNSHIPVDSSAPPPEPTLAVEVLIQSCEGLLLLDTTLGVVRFSHLSVREYLEQSGVVDTQLFVSESCLWVLQYSLNTPLYQYAADYWYKHCRSYQDLVLSTANTKDPNQKPNIPLLSTFLGSFRQASASYIKWVQESKLSIYIYSAPLCPVFIAAYAGLGELVSCLWHSEGNDMNVRNQGGDSLLDIASVYGTVWTVAEILTGGIEIDDIQHALYPACEVGKFDIVTLLLDRGADVNVTGGDYGSALGAAAYSRDRGNLNIVTLLLDRGADVNVSRGEYGSALGNAADRGNLDIVTLLLDRGADVNATGGSYGPALGAAAFNGNLNTVTLLLDRGADVNVTSGSYGSALGAAAFKGKMNIVTLFLDSGADVNVTGGSYGSALGAAAFNGNRKIVTLLLNRGADVNITGGIYGSALGAAVCTCSLNIVSLLLDRGADVNVTSSSYGSVLGAAAFLRNLNIVTLLLDRGADLHATGGSYGSVLGAAAYGGNLDIVTLLLHRGADPDIVNIGGERPRDLAERRGYTNVVELLDSGCAGRNPNELTSSVCVQLDLV